MLTAVEVRSASGALLTLPLEDVSNGLYIDDIRGLDPVKATIVSSSFAAVDGSQYQSSRRETRNIVMTIGLEPDYATESVRDLRARLYEYMMPKSEVSLTFIHEDGLEVVISGRVESLETALFSEEPAVDISIICFDPDFIDLTEVEVEGETVDDATEITVNYAGTVESGIVFELAVDRTLTEFTIYHTPPGKPVRTLDFAGNLETGDLLTITTIAGNKSLILTRTATSSSVLYGMSPQSNWIELEKGANKIRVYALGDPIPYTITYTTRYGGL
jgi:tail protein